MKYRRSVKNNLFQACFLSMPQEDHKLFIQPHAPRRQKSSLSRTIPVCGAYGGLSPSLCRINFLGPSFFRNKFPLPKKGTTPRRTWCAKNIQNQFWDHGGKHLWIKFQWPRSCLSLCKSPTNSAPRNYRGKKCWSNISNYFFPNSALQIFKLWGHNKALWCGTSKLRKFHCVFGHRVRKKILPARTQLRTSRTVTTKTSLTARPPSATSLPRRATVWVSLWDRTN